MTDNKLWQCILYFVIQMKILIVPKQNYMQVTRQTILRIQGHASAYVLNPIGNGEGSCNIYCISSTINTLTDDQFEFDLKRNSSGRA